VEELTEGERKKEENKLRMVFRLFDTDRDGHLDKEELSEALQ
jgi:Ca2+-binding EF-hand superfamily protein